MNEIKSEISLRLNFVPPRMKKKTLEFTINFGKQQVSELFVEVE